MNKALAGIVILSSLMGCASTPPMTYKYYPAKAVTVVSLTQTIICNVAKTDLAITNTPSIVTTYSSDRSKSPMEFDASALKSTFADSDLTFTWFDDGRLKSIGQGSMGQGETIIKSAFTLLATFGVGGAAPKETTIPQCNDIPDLNSGKSVTLVYETPVDYTPANFGKLLPLPPKKGYESLHRKFEGAVPPVQLKTLLPVDNPFLLKPNNPTAADVVPLKLRGTAETTVSILVSGAPIATSKVVLPTITEFSVPIPKPALFGKQMFGVALNEAGFITTVTYNSTAGAAGALNSLNTAQSTFSPSDSVKAAALKAEADVIAQTARLAKCQESPTTCQ